MVFLAEKKGAGCCNVQRPAPYYKKPHQRMWWNSDKYRIWGRHTLCNPPAVKHLSVEARHCEQRFTRHFIIIWRVSRSTLMWTISQWSLVLLDVAKIVHFPDRYKSWSGFNTTFLVTELLAWNEIGRKCLCFCRLNEALRQHLSWALQLSDLIRSPVSKMSIAKTSIPKLNIIHNYLFFWQKSPIFASDME